MQLTETERHSLDNPYDGGSAMVLADLVERLLGEIGRLREDLTELLAEAFREVAFFQKAGNRKGWWDTQSRCAAVEYGDRLVELGLWEIHPDGYGRRWWYRPLTQ